MTRIFKTAVEAARCFITEEDDFRDWGVLGGFIHTKEFEDWFHYHGAFNNQWRKVTEDAIRAFTAYIEDSEIQFPTEWTAIRTYDEYGCSDLKVTFTPANVQMTIEDLLTE